MRWSSDVSQILFVTFFNLVTVTDGGLDYCRSGHAASLFTMIFNTITRQANNTNILWDPDTNQNIDI